MKVLIVTACPKAEAFLSKEVRQANHFVVSIVRDSSNLVHEITRTTPHLVVVQIEATDEMDQVTSLFPELPILWVGKNLKKGRSKLQRALAESLRPPIPRLYADDQRSIYHDASLLTLSSGKLNRPERKEGWQKICSTQEARFVLQLQTARKNHAAAKIYLECLIQQQAGIDQEIAYRLAHGSYKALSWSRDLFCRWLGLLAHYLSDVELEYLPKPGTPGPQIDFVHHHLPIEGKYAATLVILSGIKPAAQKAIMEATTAKFDGQDDETLLALSLKLYGMAKWLEQVGRAQVSLMEAWLDPNVVDTTGDQKMPRSTHRDAGIYRDFHDLNFIVHAPQPLASILKGFHTGTTYVEEQRYLPPFADIFRICNGEQPAFNQSVES